MAETPVTIAASLAKGGGRWTTVYPELGTASVDYDDCISPEFFLDEREAVFKRWWLYVGRQERLPRPGTYFTRELPGLASVVVARDLDGQVHAFHNTCAHRGNKVVWVDHPTEESSGSCRAFHCKYHGWRYGLDGKVDHVTNADQFFDLDTSTLAMPSIHCDVFAGFVFISLATNPPPLREFLGARTGTVESYPFDRITERYGFSTRVHGNWKLATDTICEWYHPPYVHQRFLGIDSDMAEKMVPPIDAYYYELYPPHILNSVPGPPPMKPRPPGPAARDMNWVYRLFRSGLFGPDDISDIGPIPEGMNPANVQPWGNDHYWLLPNLALQIWARNWYITYSYWPESVDSHIYDIDMYFVPPTTVRERLAQEMAVHMVIELAMQDVNTIEATHNSLARQALRTFHLSDQELMIRSLHHNIRTAVEAYRAESCA